MDDLLKTYAKKRRDEAGAPLDLHLATRKLLQGEVAKLRSASIQKPRPWFSSWLVYWPQLGAAASVLLILGVGYRVLLQEQESPIVAEQLAKRQAPDAEAESLDRLNRPMLAADSPAKAEKNQDKSGAFRSVYDAESKLSLSEARESKDAAAKGGEATLRQLDKAKENLTQPTGGRADLAEFNQSTTLGADKKSVFLTRNEQAIERDALLKQVAPTAPAAPLPSQPRDLALTPTPRRMQVVDSDAQPSPVTRAKSDATAVKLLDESSTRTPAGAGGPAQNIPQEKAFYALAGATNSRGAAASERQRFLRARLAVDGLAGGFQENANQGVLVSFEMQLNGAQLRAIDADGSIYEGRFDQPVEVMEEKLTAIAAPALQPNPTPASRPSIGQTGNAVEAAKPGQAGVRFRVSGTNQTLKRLVVFEGLLNSVTTNSSPAPLGNVTASSTVDQRQQPPTDAHSLQPTRLLSSPIQGTLRIGTSNAVPVQALPVNR